MADAGPGDQCADGVAPLEHEGGGAQAALEGDVAVLRSDWQLVRVSVLTAFRVLEDLRLNRQARTIAETSDLDPFDLDPEPETDVVVFASVIVPWHDCYSLLLSLGPG